jgi:hypothetical protein
MECCPPSPWNRVRHDGGTLSAISLESCPPSRGIRIEGLLPFVSPAGWRRVFTQMVQLRDGQIRFFALLCILSGVAMLLV